MNVSVCTFFGHRDCPSAIRPRLRAVLVELIEQGVETFYVGGQGAFDTLVWAVLEELEREYPSISCMEILAYMPRKGGGGSRATLLPEGIERVPRRFAISWRNRWMVERADHVVTYVVRSWGGAAQFARLAERRGKAVHPLGEPAPTSTGPAAAPPPFSRCGTHSSG